VGERIFDHEFDQIFPRSYQTLSEAQWSPVKAGRLVAEFLEGAGPAKFIDLGCGIGKLCLYLALATELRVYGVERRKNLVTIANDLCETNAPGRVQIFHSDMLDLDWNEFDILYLYNPFMEHKCSSLSLNLIDRNIELSDRAYRHYVSGVYEKLTKLKDGQRVITFQGYGGQMPEDLKCMKTVKVDNGSVRLWAK
jgi:predicted RNA methylase